jgi:hypothetical protein
LALRTSGCQSWYLDTGGDPLTWPDTWKAWQAAMKTPDLEDFYQPEPASEAYRDIASVAAQA